MSGPRARLALLFLVYLPGLLLPRAAAAHPAQFTTLQVKVEPDGRFRAILNIDILSFALGKTSAATSNEELETLLAGPRDVLGRRLAVADEHFREELVMRTDAGATTISSWNLPGLPEVDAVLARKINPRILMPGEISFAGELPAGAHHLAIRLPYVLGDTVQVLELPDGTEDDEPVSAGAYSSGVEIDLRPPGPGDKLAGLGRDITAGFGHMVAAGWNHILFVLGLFFLSTRIVPLLWQILIFIFASSVTLGLSAYGMIRVPSSITEPLIAASLVFIAVENLFTRGFKTWSPVVVLGFGFVHGFGFASAFARAGLPRSDFLMSLVGFNIGMQCGQLAALAAAFLTVGWFLRRPWYRRVIVIPGSLLIALIASFWTVHRMVLVL